MSVRGIGRGSKPGGAKGAKEAAPAPKTNFGGKVEKTDTLVGPSGVVGSNNVGATDPVSAHALELIRQLREGQIKSRDEATKKLVANILREKVRTQSKVLNEKIFEALKDDPRLARLWKRAEEKE